MDSPNCAFKELIRRARNGDREALGELLERHRGYLRVLAQRHITGRLAARLDPSDIIQQTCLSAYRKIGVFEGVEEREFAAWLRRIHEQNIQNVIRDHALAQKRALGREERLGDQGPAPQDLRAAAQATPSQRALQNERAVELAQTLEKLPQNQREAVRLRHLEGWPLARIAEHLGRSEAATVGLIKRGMQKLREYLKPAP